MAVLGPRRSGGQRGTLFVPRRGLPMLRYVHRHCCEALPGCSLLKACWRAIRVRWSACDDGCDVCT